MYSYISGEVTQTSENTVVLDVGGIGYELCVSSFTQEKCQLGQRCRLYAYLQVKEDGLSLFGFATEEEKNMFLRLISISGIGCKVAQAILSGMDCNALAVAIFNGDTKQLTKIKGLGKKTAERIVLELKEKVVVDASAMDLPIARHADVALTKDMQDAMAILCSLGKSRADAQQLVEAASKLGATTAEQLVNMAFRIN